MGGASIVLRSPLVGRSSASKSEGHSADAKACRDDLDSQPAADATEMSYVRAKADRDRDKGKTEYARALTVRSERPARLRRSLASQASTLPLFSFGPLSARSREMQEVFAVLSRIASANLTVTLIGETGSGKDVLARALHQQSKRSSAPFVVFDCGAVAANLAESELFGHERGAFTGAHCAHAGAFEQANKGTVFLDEIAELPLDLQPKLLRALESRSLRRVGGEKSRPIDVRIIAATNRDLRQQVAAGSFRRDLYFRLAGAVVRVPPLRARFDDLPLLTGQLLTDLGHADIGVADEALAVLETHSWPGNVRELKNVLACAVTFVDHGRIEARHLGSLLDSGTDDHFDQLPLAGRTLEQLERLAIRQTLQQTNGIKAHAARALGIAVSTLYEKLKKYELENL